MGITQSVAGLNLKMLTFPQVKENALYPNTFDLGHWLFLAFGLKLKRQLFLGLEPNGFWIGTYTIGSPFSQAFRHRLELPHRLS